MFMYFNLYTRLKLAVFFVFLFCVTNTNAQKFSQLSSAEKCWIVFHPFKAKKAKRVTVEVLATIDSISKAEGITHKTGTQLDAFKHAFWMFSLAEEIGFKSANSFGKQHEKGNYEFYLEHRLEDGEMPDKVSGDMDLHNNSVGLALYKQHKNKHLSKKEKINVVRQAVMQGKMKIIAQTKDGEYLDKQGEIIPKENYFNLWENPKYLIPSNRSIMFGDNSLDSLNLQPQNKLQ